VLEREFQLDSLLHECILSYELRKIRPVPDVPERKYCVSRRKSVQEIRQSERPKKYLMISIVWRHVNAIRMPHNITPHRCPWLCDVIFVSARHIFCSY